MRTASLARRLVAVIGAVALAACGDPTGSAALVLDVAQDRVPTDGVVDVRIHNAGTANPEFGYCDFNFERQVGNLWVPAASFYACPSVGLGVPPGMAIELPLAVPEAVGAGTYRVRLRIRDDSYHSDAFAVEPAEPPSP